MPSSGQRAGGGATADQGSLCSAPWVLVTGQELFDGDLGAQRALPTPRGLGAPSHATLASNPASPALTA